MSETLLSEAKIAVGSLTGPASLGADRSLLQITIRDGTDNVQLNRAEAKTLGKVIKAWLNVSQQPRRGGNRRE